MFVRLNTFIIGHIEAIVDEWQAVGRASSPSLDRSEAAELRDVVRGVLLAMAQDMACETGQPRPVGERRGCDAEATASSAARHGALRQRCGLGAGQLVGEFHSMRAIALTRWYFSGARLESAALLQQVIRFNQVVDCALRDAIESFVATLTVARDKYLFTLGSDLRSPLSTIHLSSAVLGRPDFSAGTRQGASRRMRRALVQMDGLISDLVEYTRDRGVPGIPLDRTLGDLGQLCEEALDTARTGHPGRVFDLVTSGDLVASVDAPRIHQALSNLLHNAVRHGDGQTPIRLAAVGTATSVDMSVWNAGPGIPEELMGDIFEPWVRAPRDPSESTERAQTSLGLGLFIARDIVTAHGGTIVATSNHEAGTTFTITLARTPAAAPDTAVRAPSGAAVASPQTC